MFACKHVLFFVTQIYSLLFCHADFADDADLSCYCGCRLYLPLLPEYYGLYYFVPYFSIKRLFFCKDSHIFRLRSIFVPYFSIKALFLWCFGDYITNHLRDFKSKPRICGTRNKSRRFRRFTQIFTLILEPLIFSVLFSGVVMPHIPSVNPL